MVRKFFKTDFSLFDPDRFHYYTMASCDSPLKETVKVVPQPERLKIALYPHQRANIYQMERLEKEKSSRLPDGLLLEANVGILGDPPGTGKTLTTVGLICRDRMPWKESFDLDREQVCTNSNGSIRVIRERMIPTIKTTLIVTPPSLLRQWETELCHSDLKYLLVERRSHINALENYDVVICTISMYPDLAADYKNVRFKRFVYDEMDSAYIPNMPAVSAGFYWFVSATFDQVIEECIRSRRMHFLKQLFISIFSDEFDRQQLLQCVTVQSTEKLRKLRPVPKEYEEIFYEIGAAPVVEQLREMMDHELVQMIEAGNIRDAIRHLGGSEENGDGNIADLLRRRAIASVNAAEQKVLMYQGRQRKEWADRLIDEQRKLSVIEERIKDMESGECSLCNLKMENTALWPCCQNLSCVGCAARWLPQHKTCPFCRAQDPKIVHLNVSQSEEKKVAVAAPKRQHADKYECLMDIVQQGRKVLIFAAFDNQFSTIAATLIAAGVSYSRLQGTAKQRADILNGYTKGSIQVLILNSRMNGAGLNLQCTTDIVLWHCMPAALTKQMIGRALRYGMDHHLKIHKLFTKAQEEQFLRDLENGDDE